MRKAIRGFGSGLSDTGVHGDVGIRAGGQSGAAESGGESKLRACRWAKRLRWITRVRGRKGGRSTVVWCLTARTWRTGANEATTFVTTADVMVGGTHVPAGSYTIFTIPNKDKWTLIISKKTGEWGTDYPGPGNDLARIEMKASALPAAAENFTIAFDKSSGGCALRIDGRRRGPPWKLARCSRKRLQEKIGNRSGCLSADQPFLVRIKARNSSRVCLW